MKDVNQINRYETINYYFLNYFVACEPWNLYRAFRKSKESVFRLFQVRKRRQIQKLEHGSFT